MVPSLPTELLTNIAEYLDDTSSFNLSNKRCYHAALPVRYRQVTLPRMSYDKYIPQLVGRTSYIRTVNITTEEQFRHERLLGLVVEPFLHAQRASYPKKRPYSGLWEFLKTTQVQDLYWSSDDPVPPCIVQFMKGRRLHLMHFRPDKHRIDYRKVLSPSLRTVSIAFSRQERTVLLHEVVARDLDRLCLSGSEPSWEVGVPRGSVKRLYIDPKDGGHHHRVSTVHWKAGTLHVLETWLDFSVLQLLHLEQVNHADGEWLCQAQLSLVDLKLGRYLDPLPQPRYLDAIPRTVTRLTLMEVDLDTVSRLLKRLRLTRLGIPNTVVTEEWLSCNAEHFKLVELSVGVQRTHDVFKSLGRLGLERLHLRFTSSWFESFMTLSEGHMKDVCRFHIIRELAMDEDLARAIFSAISQPSLELTLEAQWPVIKYRQYYPRDGQYGWGQPDAGLATPDIISLLKYVARPFSCSSGTVKSTWRMWEDLNENLRDLYCIKAVDGIARGPRLGRAVKALWPGIEHAELKDVWHSFPIGDCTEPPWME